jgi:hypothetical protein
MNPVLPFRLKVPGKDEFKGLHAESTSFEFHGLARLDDGVLTLEWAGSARVQRVNPLSVRDEQLRLPAETLAIPAHRLRAAQLVGRWWRRRLEISSRDLGTLAIIPSEDGGMVRLWFAGRDREIAAALAAEITRAIHASADQAPRLSARGDDGAGA